MLLNCLSLVRSVGVQLRGEQGGGQMHSVHQQVGVLFHFDCSIQLLVVNYGLIKLHEQR